MDCSLLSPTCSLPKQQPQPQHPNLRPACSLVCSELANINEQLIDRELKNDYVFRIFVFYIIFYSIYLNTFYFIDFPISIKQSTFEILLV